MPFKDKDIARERQREYQRRHYEKKKQYYIDQAAQQREYFKQYVAQIKESTPCTDCGNYYPSCVMDFDHLPGTEKLADVSALIRYNNKSRIDAEIEKCELVCANCHRIRTNNRV